MPHKAYVKTVPGARTAVLMVHGILGSPRHFDFLLPYIPADWEVYNIVLDGHGGTARDFARTSRKKLERQVEDEVARVCCTHEQVVVVAHSMGCMLTSNAIVKLGLEDKIAGAFFLGAALYPMCTLPIVKTSVRMVYCKPNEQDVREMAGRARCGTTLHKRLWEYLTWIPRFIDLFSLAAYTRRRLPHYRLPMIALQSYKDEVVGRASIKPFLKNPYAHAEFLKTSTHFYYTPADQRRIVLMFNQLLARVQKQTKITAR